MKKFVLSYYPQFKCVAEKCKHTCCAGWEIYIDQKTLTDYKGESSAFGDQLRKGIVSRKSKFKRDKQGRCVFLNQKGLCDIIINLGEKSLCQVCSDHPRFRSFFDDRVEMGLGFCCEQATKIILSTKTPVLPILVEEDSQQTELGFLQQKVLEFRQSVFDLLKDENADINQKIQKILGLCKCQITKEQLFGAVKVFSTFESIDKGWVKSVKSLKKLDLSVSVEKDMQNYALRFLENSVYRHLSECEDVSSAQARVVGCVICWFMVQNLFAQNPTDFEGLVQVVRAFSCEVEYSQKNINKLFNYAKKCINS